MLFYREQGKYTPTENSYYRAMGQAPYFFTESKENIHELMSLMVDVTYFFTKSRENIHQLKIHSIEQW